MDQPERPPDSSSSSKRDARLDRRQGARIAQDFVLPRQDPPLRASRCADDRHAFGLRAQRGGFERVVQRAVAGGGEHEALDGSVTAQPALLHQRIHDRSARFGMAHENFHARPGRRRLPIRSNASRAAGVVARPAL